MRHILPCLMLVAALDARAASCPSGSHLASADEKSFNRTALAAIKAAMPKLGAGWKVSNETEIPSSLAMICNEPEKNPMRLVHFLRLERTEGMDEKRRALKAAQELANTPSTEQKAKLAKLDEQQKKLSTAADAAADRGKQGEVDKLLAKISKLSDDMNAVRLAMKATSDAAVEKALLRDSEALIEVLVNPLSQDLKVAQRTSVDGAAAAFRVEDGGRDGEAGWREGATVAYFGDWKATEKGGGAELRATPKGKNAAKAQTIVVRVVAEKERAAQLLKQVALPSILALTK